MGKANDHIILLVTTARSLHATALKKALEELGATALRLDTDQLSAHSWPNYHVSTSSDLASIPLSKTARRTTNLSAITVVWWDELLVPPELFAGLQHKEWARLETEKALLWMLTSFDALYVNHPTSILAASNKLLQLNKARQLGFTIPETLVTGNARQAKCFAKSATVYKPLSRPTPATVGDERILLTSLVNAKDVASPSIACKLSLLQRYVLKSFEVRVTVVGKQCFAVAIHSQRSDRAKTDWRRYDIANTPHYIHKLPIGVSDKCVALTTLLGLRFSTIDLIVTPSRQYVFLELNPSGLWLWLEKLTGLGITVALARHLHRASGAKARANPIQIL